MTKLLKLFADCADLATVQRLAGSVNGFTTNPTLMRRAGVTDYDAFALMLLAAAPGLPVSLEVIADHPAEILRQARLIGSWSENVYVKIPVTTTTGEPLINVIREASQEVKVNVTAVFTLDQVRDVAYALSAGKWSYISVFAGRIADTGRDPVPTIAEAVDWAQRIAPRAGVIWASPREVLNYVQAEQAGCAAITMTPDLIAKLPELGKPLEQFSLETVQMFHRDAGAAGYEL